MVPRGRASVKTETYWRQSAVAACHPTAMPQGIAAPLMSRWPAFARAQSRDPGLFFLNQIKRLPGVKKKK